MNLEEMRSSLERVMRAVELGSDPALDTANAWEATHYVYVGGLPTPHVPTRWFSDPTIIVAAASAEGIMTVAGMKETVRKAQLAERSELAARFAVRAREVHGVVDIRLTSLEPDLIVTVVIEDDDLARDLELHALFVDIVRQTDDPSVGELQVRRPGEPDADEGASLA